MNKPYILLILLSFLMQEVSAQKNVFLLDLHYLPIKDCNSMGGSIGYFRKLTERRAVGVKMLLNTNTLTLSEGQDHNWNMIFDATQRYRMKKKGRSNWMGELGASVFVQVVKKPPYEYEPICPVSEEELQKFKAHASQWHTQTYTFFGIAGAVGWEYSITRDCQVGINVLLNTYYAGREEGICPLILPSLRIARSF